MTTLILEDDTLWQLKLRVIVEQLGNPTIIETATLHEAETYLSNHSPDLVIADIILHEQLSFTLFANRLRSYPIVFISGHPEDVYLKQSLALPNTTFLVKPFHQFSLISAINTLLSLPLLSAPAPEVAGLSVIGKHRQRVTVPFSDILYIEAEGNYAIIQLADRKHLLKRSLRKLIEQVDDRFVQVQKAFVINTDFLNRVDLSEGQLNIGGKSIPIGRVYRKKLVERLNR